MPKCKNQSRMYKLVSDGGKKRGFDHYGAFNYDEEGLEEAERFKVTIENRDPNLDIRIIEE